MLALNQSTECNRPAATLSFQESLSLAAGIELWVACLLLAGCLFGHRSPSTSLISFCHIRTLSDSRWSPLQILQELATWLAAGSSHLDSG